MKKVMIRKKTVSIMWMMFVFILTGQTICAKPKNITVHPYAPFVIPETGLGGEAYPSHVRNDVASARFNVKVADIKVAAIRYDNTGFGNQGHNMDVARFASNSQTPEIEVNVKGDNEINSVTIHPVRFYPQEKLKISPDKRSVTFEMAKELPYAIVIINGNDPQDASTSNPQLTLINDPLEDLTEHPLPTAPNVLDFKKFAENYLKENPITETSGQVCRPAGSITDASLNDGRMFTWNYEKGVFVPYTDRIVAFPNMRKRSRNDVSDALQAALEVIKNTPELNTLYIPAGTYLWSGLRIINWNGDRKNGGKPLFVYTDENALMINRLKECRESNEPAIYIANSSYVTISGRGMHDGQGCFTFAMDRKDARNTPHQGGAVIKKSNHITFNDTYIRDSQQWNWETHDATDIELNNIKGLSPYNHGWIDGLNLSSGKNITVNGSITLGNDDTFATGHYNPSNEFPIRTYRETPSVNLVNTNENPAEIRHTFAAAGVYNKDRMKWSRDGGSENIRVHNAIGWTRTAHCIRIGGNVLVGKPQNNSSEKNIKGYYFDNFHSIAGRKAGGNIRIQFYDKTDLPAKGELVIKNCSFWTASKAWALIPASKDNHTSIRKVVLQNLYFAKPITEPSAIFSDIEELTIKQLHIGGRKIDQYDLSGIPQKLENVTHFKNDFKD